MSVTTASGNNFERIDCTYHKARKQSEILNEGVGNEAAPSSKVSVPRSHTPEQVKSFYEAKISDSNSQAEKSLYKQTIWYIDQYLKLKKEAVKNELKDMLKDMDESGDDIVEEE